MDQTRRSDLDELLGESDLMTLVELQKFLADELTDTLGTAPDLSRAFMPITDGLGLEAPVAKPEVPTWPARGSRSSLLQNFPSPFEEEVAAPPRESLETKLQQEILEERARPEPERGSLSHLMQGAPAAPEPVSYEEPEVSEPRIEPPPMPQASLFRRLLSGIVDEVFVLSVWLLALVITSHSLADGPGDISARLMKEFATPSFLRFAVLEFVALWLGYCTVCLALMDLTFGMWVWGMRVSYGHGVSRGGKIFRKISRAWFSFLFLAPIVPTILLVFRRRGRNLLDLLSGTQLYRTSV